ncbi:MAG: TraR/DksA C4-type zinc finger protein [Anaerolineales bacterium]|nr:TraR/DksA C4-type zinc finger protein [Anaerolineales bacterium]
MHKLQSLLDESAAHHNHLCPRQVLGVRMGLLGGQVLGIDVPQTAKRMFVFVELDGCGMGGIATATGCFVRRRTMRVLDFGKLAATFVDMENGRSVRIHPHPQNREYAIAALPDEPDHWQRQLAAYQFLPDEQLFIVEAVELTVSMEKIISQPGLRVLCAQCGEEISNERQVVENGRILCRACAGATYYRLQRQPADMAQFKPAYAINGRSNLVHTNHFDYR